MTVNGGQRTARRGPRNSQHCIYELKLLKLCDNARFVRAGMFSETCFTFQQYRALGILIFAPSLISLPYRSTAIATDDMHRSLLQRCLCGG